MTALNVPNTFVASTTADANEVNANFSAVVDYVNDNVVLTDGSHVMTQALDVGSNKVVNVATPTSATDAANKQYVDDSVPQRAGGWVARTSGTQSIPGVTATNIQFPAEYSDSDGFWPAGATSTTMTVPAGLGGVYILSAFYSCSTTNAVYIHIVVNGTTYQAPASAGGTANITVCVPMAAGETATPQIYCSGANTITFARFAFYRVSI